MESIGTPTGLISKPELLRIADLLTHYANILEMHRTNHNAELYREALDYAEKLRQVFR